MADGTTTLPNTSTFQSGDTASGVAAKLGMTPAQFLSYNPDLAAKGASNDYKGLTGEVGVGQTYNTGPQSSNLINTSTQSRQNFNQNSGDLANALAKFNLNGTPTPDGNTPSDKTTTDTTTGLNLPANDPFVTQLNNISSGEDAATKALIASATAAYSNNLNGVNKQYENYKAGLMQLGIESGAAKATPDLLAGHIQQAANEQLNKIQTIQATLAKTIAAANLAKENNDFKTLNEKMAYAKQLQIQKLDAIKAMHDSITQSPAVAAAQIDPATAQQMLDTINTFTDDKTKHDFIAGIASKYRINPMAVVASLNDISTKAAKADLATQNARATLHNKLNPKSTSTKGGTDGTFKYSSDQLATYNSLLKSGGKVGNTTFNAQGPDGYVDPGAYATVYQLWSKNGGTNKGFLAKFPVKMVNPSSYSLIPEALRPKTKSSSTGGQNA